MALENASAEAITRREGRGSILLWFGILTAPTCWATQMVVNYSLDELISCSPASQTRGVVLGVTAESIILIVNVVLTLVSVLALASALRCLKKTGSGDDSTGGRARWMALSGVFVSALFIAMILVGFGPPLLLDACVVSL